MREQGRYYTLITDLSLVLPLSELSVCRFQGITQLVRWCCFVLVNSCHIPNVVSVPTISPQAKFPATHTDNSGIEP